MSVGVKQKAQEKLNHIIKRLEENSNKEKSAIIVEFAKRYFSTVSAEDVCERDIQTLYGKLISHWRLIETRQKGEAKIQVYNPTIKKFSWASNHTIVQIVHDDMPFLVDSVRMEINHLGFLTSFIIHLGDLSFKRNAKGKVTDLLKVGQSDKDSSHEAVIYIEIEQQLAKKMLNFLERSLSKVLSDVTLAVNDWQAMLNRMEKSLLELQQYPPPIETIELRESKAFLNWLKNDHFTFLGCRDYTFLLKSGEPVLESIQGTGLGVLRGDDKVSVRYLSNLPPLARKLALSPQILIFAKTRTRSTVHRPAYTDYIGVKRFDKAGKLIGERRFIGLYTSSAYNSSTISIPFIRHKVEKVIRKSKFSHSSHAGKALLNILENLPRDDLFQAPSDELLKLGMDILQLQDRQRIRLFIRIDGYGRFYSCLVFIPRDKFNAELCEKMEYILSEELSTNEVSFEPLLSESALVCVHFVAYVNGEYITQPDIAAIETRLFEVGQTWQDKLHISLIDRYGEKKGLRLYRRYETIFPLHYQESFSSELAVSDISRIEELIKGELIHMDFYCPAGDSKFVCFKVFQRYCTTPLSDALPILENMGMRVISERPYQITIDNEVVWINDFDMLYNDDKALEIDQVRDNFQKAFAAIWLNKAKNDIFNRLILTINLTWQEISLLRAYAQYFRQIGMAFSATYIAETLNSNLVVTKALLKLFKLRFDPHLKRSEEKVRKQKEKITYLLNHVMSLDEDRILHGYLEVILATLRVNFYQKNVLKHDKFYLAFKINPHLIQDIPLPRPMYEIYIYSPRFEGIHLRAAKVARGGIRWSDRREDFRTEILGLMKAQQVKNACIIPQGAKGGFVTKSLIGATREQILEEGIQCYRLFIQAMLDITDNIVNKQVVLPKDTVIYDEPDPYLVVAADKGTASFSDIANEIAISNHFWLSDAFASGGSTGYDHKKMGITSRGAWESVKRHFREMDRDIQKSSFTAIGIGDMSGDVFGNGVLLSRYMKLVAAFNHMHIFIDPNPNVEKSYKERQRLFRLSRSTWKDYNPAVLSKGGGVFSRSDKAIKLTSPIKNLFKLKKNHLTPNELIRCILSLPVDLLWNGGIGTFVKSSREDHLSVGDRTNDVIRINANELRCKVIGEGGNLGLTQLARIEYDLNGGHIYADFIDNSAGVNCSDHEVNIKILLNEAVSDGKLNLEERNVLLTNMEQDVAHLVLKDNYRQTQAINLAAIKGLNNLDLYVRYMRSLKQKNQLDLNIEFLPNDKEVSERKSKGKGLTKPEISVLFAYSKNILKEQILKSDVPEDAYLSQLIWHEFPRLIRDRCGEAMKDHILRREIIATQVCNTLINEMGFTFISKLRSETGAPVSDVVRAFTISQKIFGKRSLWSKIEKLDLKVENDTQFLMMRELNRLIRRSARWFLRHYRKQLEINVTVSKFAKPIAFLANHLPKYMIGVEHERYLERVQMLMETGVPKKIASRIAAANLLFSALDIIECVILYKWSIEDVASTYYLLGEKLELTWLRQTVTLIQPRNRWEALLRTNLRDDLDYYQRTLSIVALQSKISSASTGERIQTWLEVNQNNFKRWQETVTLLKGNRIVDIVQVSVIMRTLVDVVQACFSNDTNQLAILNNAPIM